MSIGKHWMYHADALPEFAQKLVRLNDGKAERYTARDGWVDAEGVQAEVKWTGDWDPVSDDDVHAIIANIETLSLAGSLTIGVQLGG